MSSFKRSQKIFGDSFLKNGTIEFRPEALIGRTQIKKWEFFWILWWGWFCMFSRVRNFSIAVWMTFFFNWVRPLSLFQLILQTRIRLIVNKWFKQRLLLRFLLVNYKFKLYKAKIKWVICNAAFPVYPGYFHTIRYPLQNFRACTKYKAVHKMSQFDSKMVLFRQINLGPEFYQ